VIKTDCWQRSARIGNRSDLLLREESDISQIAANQLGWRVIKKHRATLGGRGAQSSGFEMLWPGYSQLLSFLASKHW
jgi:hypothetical protein